MHNPHRPLTLLGGMAEWPWCKPPGSRKAQITGKWIFLILLHIEHNIFFHCLPILYVLRLASVYLFSLLAALLYESLSFLAIPSYPQSS